ncbi:MAG: hypothetical protein FJ217_05720 [Ignavibacteria bacterium]|nr:hypothetical protein [Ignavibacteria bacterium]
MLRFVLLIIALYLLFRVIQRVVRFFMRGWQQGEGERRREYDLPHQPLRKEPPQYRDVKDARFKDLPDDESKPS